MQKYFWEEIINFSQNKKFKNFYDISFKNHKNLNQYNSIEMYFMVYPYATNITSENIRLLPFDEYVKDVISEKSSVYIKILNTSNNFFWIFLWFVIILIFLIIDAKMLYSVEAIASIFGFYIIGKELWYDLNKFLIKLTRNRKIVYKESDYTYELKSRNALTNYTYFAKKQRYGKSVVLPKKMSYIEQSNSITVRMSFDTKEFLKDKDDLIYLLSIKIDESLINDFKKFGFMLWCKISFNQKSWIFVNKYDVSQSINLEKIWCLDTKWIWNDNDVFVRNNLCLGDIKYYQNNNLINQKILIKR